MSGLLRFAKRDALLVIATVVAWIAASQLDLLALEWLAGLLLGGVAYQLHEWGHVLGARASRAQFSVAERLWSPFLFSFDASANGRRQFLVMSGAGFLATAWFLLFFGIFLPLETTRGSVAMGAALVLAGITVLVELPIALWVAAGKAIPKKIQLF